MCSITILNHNLAWSFLFLGDYKDGVEEGEGTITYEDGNILKGEFSDGKIHGHAVFRYPNGDQREGFFFENVLDGQVIYTKADGMIVIELWKNGENLESKSQIVRPSNSVVQSTIQTPTTVEILKPVTKSKSTTNQDPNSVSSTTESNRLSTSFDINALRKAIRSGDRTQMFSSNPREPRIQTESMDVKKLREETDIANEEFLRSVFLRVNGWFKSFSHIGLSYKLWWCCCIIIFKLTIYISDIETAYYFSVWSG